MIGRNGIDKIPPHTLLSRWFTLASDGVVSQKNKKNRSDEKIPSVFEFRHSLIFTFLKGKRKAFYDKEKRRKGRKLRGFRLDIITRIGRTNWGRID